MRFIRVGEPGQERPGLLIDTLTYRDISAFTQDIDAAFLGRLASGAITPHDFDVQRPTRIDKERLGPPIARPGKVVCIGLNYADHAAEAGMPVPREPIVFMKAANTVVGPNDDLHLPPGSQKTDWEVELGVVIGAQCRYLDSPAEASSRIAGLCVSNDVSEREYQLERSGQWDLGKSCETFNPLGPWLVTPDEVADLRRLPLWLDVNGVQRQRGSTSTMIFDIYHVIWYLSQFMVLEAGDLINTGTPPGVGLGMKPPSYLKAGDVVELGIEGLGAQRQGVVDAPRSGSA